MDTLARSYPESNLRCMTDIDILVRQEDFNQAQDSLLEMGYQKELNQLREDYWRQKQCHIAFNKGTFLVEVHWGLDFKRGKDVILPHIWERIKELEIGEHTINVLSAEDAFFAFALHLRRFGNILSLKQVLDVARITQESPDFNWDYVLEESYKGRMCATVYFILTQARLFTNINMPQGILEKLGLPWWHRALIAKFITQYTFEMRASLKKNYLKAHLLLYDSIKDSVRYLINIPYEQFCKFYDLKPYTAKSNLFYQGRLVYVPTKKILQCLLRGD